VLAAILATAGSSVAIAQSAAAATSDAAAAAPSFGDVPTTPEEIERVDVLYGPFSAAYPGNSVGAVVDYVTRMPKAFEAHVAAGLSQQQFKLYSTDESHAATQSSASIGNRHGGFSWWFNVSHMDSDGQPLTFPTRLFTQASGTGGTPVTGAVPDRNRSNQNWYLLGTATQYHTVQDHAKAKLAYSFSDSLRLGYTLGTWRNDAQGRPKTYLRDAAGNPVYSGTVNIDGRTFALTASDFNQSRENLFHVMHALSLKQNKRGVFDWEVAASLYDYAKDRARTATVALPAADRGGPGRITDQEGTGWNTLAIKGVWRPDGADGAHQVDFGVGRDSYALRTLVSDQANDWISGDPGAFASRFAGNTRTTSLFAQDAWRFAETWKTVLGRRLENWHASDGINETAYTGTVTRKVCDATTRRCLLRFADRDGTWASPKAAVSHQVSEDWVVKASTGRAIRLPTVSELYQGGVNTQGQAINNDPNLKPERSWTTELSAELTRNTTRLRATLFHENTRDALYSQLNTASNANTVQNVRRIATRGVELAALADGIVRGVDLVSSVTYADSRIRANDGYVAVPGDTIGKQQPRVPRWRAAAQVSWHASDALTTTFGARYSGAQFSTLDNSDPNGFAYQGASKFFTTELKVHWQVAKAWSASFGVDNLNNYKFWNFHPYPQRTFLAELKWAQP